MLGPLMGDFNSLPLPVLCGAQYKTVLYWVCLGWITLTCYKRWKTIQRELNAKYT